MELSEVRSSHGPSTARVDAFAGSERERKGVDPLRSGWQAGFLPDELPWFGRGWESWRCGRLGL